MGTVTQGTCIIIISYAGLKKMYKPFTFFEEFQKNNK